MCLDLDGPTVHWDFLSRPDWRLPQPEPDFGLIFTAGAHLSRAPPCPVRPGYAKNATTIAVSITAPRTFVAEPMADHGTSRRSRNCSVTAVVETKAAAT